MIRKMVIKNARTGRWLQFIDPVEVFVSFRPEEIAPLLNNIERKAKSQGFYMAGFISYEAASGFDSALKTKAPGSFPLLCFGLYPSAEELDSLDDLGSEVPSSNGLSAVGPLPWQLSQKKDRYIEQIIKIKRLIQSGDTYQVNYTIRQFAEFVGDSWLLFSSIASDALYGAFIDLDDYTICCASPELFFDLNKGTILSRPMKGTAPRGTTLDDDLEQKARLFESVKDRAENIMIVDMIRNDIGKVALNGSVNVERLFEIEKYPTVWQMTSSVSASTSASVSDIMRALFPCASITGAPKVNTMGIIESLEDRPRNIYTGSIGFITPQADAQFNVAIRTALINKKKKLIEYGIGGGIIWDSCAEDEFEECLLKTQLINMVRSENSLSLFETMLWTSMDGYFLLDYHQKRLRASAQYFDYPINAEKISQLLDDTAKSLHKSDQQPSRYRVRLLLAKSGSLNIDYIKIENVTPDYPLKVVLANKSVNSNDRYLYHKTTQRYVYEQAMEEFPGMDDVLLWNEKREVTEFTVANVVIRVGSNFLTPKLQCGLLAGTFRQFLLDKGEIEEAIITLADVRECDEVFLINSVRRWQPAILLIA